MVKFAKAPKRPQSAYRACLLTAILATGDAASAAAVGAAAAHLATASGGVNCLPAACGGATCTGCGCGIGKLIKDNCTWTNIKGLITSATSGGDTTQTSTISVAPVVNVYAAGGSPTALAPADQPADHPDAPPGAPDHLLREELAEARNELAEAGGADRLLRAQLGEAAQRDTSLRSELTAANQRLAAESEEVAKSRAEAAESRAEVAELSAKLAAGTDDDDVAEAEWRRRRDAVDKDPIHVGKMVVGPGVQAKWSVERPKDNHCSANSLVLHESNTSSFYLRERAGWVSATAPAETLSAVVVMGLLHPTIAKTAYYAYAWVKEFDLVAISAGGARETLGSFTTKADTCENPGWEYFALPRAPPADVTTLEIYIKSSYICDIHMRHPGVVGIHRIAFFA